jgi:hypothetical protein
MKTGPLALLARPGSPLKNAVQPEFFNETRVIQRAAGLDEKDVGNDKPAKGGGARAAIKAPRTDESSTHPWHQAVLCRSSDLFLVSWSLEALC